MQCKDPLCNAIQTTGNEPCKSADDQCDYEIEYADSGSSLGVLVADYYHLHLTNGSQLSPRLTFGYKIIHHPKIYIHTSDIQFLFHANVNYQILCGLYK